MSTLSPRGVNTYGAQGAANGHESPRSTMGDTSVKQYADHLKVSSTRSLVDWL